MNLKNLLSPWKGHVTKLIKTSEDTQDYMGISQNGSITFKRGLESYHVRIMTSSKIYFPDKKAKRDTNLACEK